MAVYVKATAWPDEAPQTDRRTSLGMFDNCRVLITSGTGSFGHAFLPMMLERYNPKKVIVFSRDEMKQ
jgi:FlaA1/EpsC-like NDP-sugar epimerase